jgi:aldehyde dehydrogenase (NAD+)
MTEQLQFYIDGAWVDPVTPRAHDVVNPATETAFAQVSLGSAEDVDRAVAAARGAFPSFSATSREERLALLDRIVEIMTRRSPELAQVISREMGAPMRLAAGAQVPSGVAHFTHARHVLAEYVFEETVGRSLVVREPIGVCALITPWNWPLNQIACKVAPALAAGCTMVLKPSEVAPLSAMLLAEVLHEAGVPAGVFNLVNGDGPTVGAALAAHPDVDLISFTGSTRAGIEVAKAAAPTVKRVTQELGGKSANIILDDADLKSAITGGVRGCMSNSGQSCNAPTRMFVPRAMLAEAEQFAKATVDRIVVGDPAAEGTSMGPVVSEAQYERVQELIAAGLAEGATAITGGVGRPDALRTGYYVQPTVFSGVTNDMRIAREEIFGPVLCMIPYDTLDEAIRMANDTPYGLSSYVWSGSRERAQEVARKLRTGNVHINGAPVDHAAPFGGYKQSGNGREWGEYGFEEFLEVKAIMGAAG